MLCSHVSQLQCAPKSPPHTLLVSTCTHSSDTHACCSTHAVIPLGDPSHWFNQPCIRNTSDSTVAAMLNGTSDEPVSCQLPVCHAGLTWSTESAAGLWVRRAGRDQPTSLTIDGSVTIIAPGSARFGVGNVTLLVPVQAPYDGASPSSTVEFTANGGSIQLGSWPLTGSTVAGTLAVSEALSGSSLSTFTVAAGGLSSFAISVSGAVGVGIVAIDVDRCALDRS